MAFYSDELIEEIRSGNDIVDVISGYVRLQKRGSSYLGLCPFHNEKTPSFAVSGAKQLYHCFGCGAGGNVFTFLMEYENYSFKEAMEALAERIGVELPTQEMNARERQEADRRSRVLEINKTAAKYFYAQLRMEQGKQAFQYLTGRQLSQKTMQQFGLGYANKFSDDLYRYLRGAGYDDEILKESGLVTLDERRGGYDKFWNRVMFPIMDVNSRVIGFGGRVMGEGEPKYLNSPETVIFDKSRNLYGLNAARRSKEARILLCEGYMDVIALHQAGFDSAVASLGTAFTPGHASLLKRYTKEVYLTFDSDAAGIRAALRALPILKEAGLGVRVIDMKPYKDPDEFIKALGTEAYRERIERAQNGFLFEISVLEQQYNLRDPEGKTSFYQEAARRLAQFEEELERNNYIEAIAEKYQIGFENLRRLVGRAAAEGVVPRTPLKSGIHANKPKEDGMDKSQKLLLTWLIEQPGLFEVIRPYLGPEDFTGELYGRIARILFDQYEKEGGVNPAKIVSMFEEEEQQREVASLFHTRIGAIETKKDQEKALKETIVRMKQSSIEYRSTHLEPADLEGLKKIVEDKRQLQEIQKLHISIN